MNSSLFTSSQKMGNMQQKRLGTQPRFFYGYWILFVAFLCQVISGFFVYASNLYIVPLGTDFGWNRSSIMAGGLVSLPFVAFFPLYVQRVLYRVGPKWVIAVGALTTGIGFVLLSLTQALWQFYLFSIIVGLGGAASGVVPASMVVCNWFEKRRGFAIGVLGAGIGVGGITMPILIGTLIFPNFGWRMGYLVSGIITAGVLIPLSLLIIRARPEEMGLYPDNCAPTEEE